MDPSQNVIDPEIYHTKFREQAKDINSHKFWEDRLEWAKQIGEIHRAIYYTSIENWTEICDLHCSILQQYLTNNDTILDCGCGYGRLAGLLAKQCKRYVGVDFNEALLNEARNTYPGVEFIQADLTKLPFEDKEFNWAICISIKDMIIENIGIEEWHKIEVEIHRVSQNTLLLEYNGNYEVHSSWNT